MNILKELETPYIIVEYKPVLGLNTSTNKEFSVVVAEEQKEELGFEKNKIDYYLSVYEKDLSSQEIDYFKSKIDSFYLAEEDDKGNKIYEIKKDYFKKHFKEQNN